MKLHHMSINNEMKARAVIGEPTPEVGMGATMLVGSDRYGCTINRIFMEGKRQVLEVTHDKTKLVGGAMLSEEQTYEYVPQPNAKRHYFAKNEAGFWQEMHYKIISSTYDAKTDERTDVLSKRLSVSRVSVGLRIGERDEYRDPSF